MKHSLKSLQLSILFFILFLTVQLSAALSIPTTAPTGRPVNVPASSVVGTTKGEFSVNQGTANYTLKIDVPPGVAGMEPKLSLNYSSGGGNGYMGVGWSIGGVSAITRCPQTKAVDGANHKFGVKYNSDDRFCLDGQRLIVVNGLPYGADGAEYRTEINNYSKVISRGSYGGGPRYFDVYTKSGLRYIYGAAATTYEFTKPGLAMKLWKVDRIIDTYNNTISFNYTVDYAKGIHRLNKVTYADNTIQYNYEARSDVMKGYHGGYPLLVDKRLKEVIVKTGSTEVRRYKVTYTNEPYGAKRSKVASITEHVVEGDLRKLSFTYSSQGISSFAGASHKISNYGYSTGGWRVGEHPRMMVDVNGDGLTDVVGFAAAGVYVSLGTGSGFKSKSLWIASFGSNSGGWHAAYHPRMLSDVNGDGLPDIVGFADGGVYVALNTGSSFSAQRKWIAAFGAKTTDIYEEIKFFNQTRKIYGWKIDKHERILSDVNGDGLPDIVGFANDGVYVALNTGSSFAHSSKWNNGYSYNSGWKTENHLRMLTDINGDGLPDIVGFANDGVYVALNTGSSFAHSSKWNNGFSYNSGWRVKNHPRMIADTNGDGLPDIVGFANDGVYVALNTGSSFAYSSKWNNGFSYNSGWRVKNHPRMIADTNGDGLPDIVGFANDGVYVALNTGSSFAHSLKWNNGYSYNSGWRTENHLRMLTDINGDGLPDIVGFASSGVYVSQNNRQLSNIERISNNTDQNIYITYKNMTDKASRVYAQIDKTNTKPWNSISKGNIPVVMPMNLVYSVKSSNGIGGLNEVQYKYHDFIVNKLHGSQGFRHIINYDMTSKMASGTFYKQIGIKNGADDTDGYQFTGMPYYSYTGRAFTGIGASKKLDTWGKWLSRTSLAYKDVSTHSKIHEPYTYSNIQTVYDPDSKAAIKNIYHYNYLSTDGLGNIVKTVDRTYDYVNKKNFYKTTINEYTAENKTKWHIGRLTKATVTHSQTDGGTVVRSSTFKYNGNGVLSEEVANAGTSLALKKTYIYDGHGNKIKETVSGSGVATATTTFGYDSKGKFQTKVTNAAGLSEYRTYDARFGTLKTLKGPNGLTTTWIYDGMGRKVEEKRADGTKTNWRHEWGGNIISAPHVLYSVVVSSTGKPAKRLYYDMLGRDVGSYTYTMSKGSRTEWEKRRILVRKFYNAKGELYQESLPHYKDETEQFIRTTYDKYGRAIRVTKPGPNGKTQLYTTVNSNFTSTVTDPRGLKKQTVQNAIGQTISITDAYGRAEASIIRYKYDAAGNLLSTTDAGGHVIAMKYDVAGNKTYMKDPDLGVWYYQYNAAGKLIKQWSGTGGVAVSKHYSWKRYDVLGRVIVEETKDSIKTDATYSYNYKTYKYGTNTASIGSRGKLLEAYASSKLDGQDWHAEKKTMYYDSLGRPKSTNTYIYGRGNYLTSTTYDAYSRPSTVTYPNGYKITNHYNYGILDYVKGSDGKIHYSIDEVTAFGEVAQAHFANGVKTKVAHDSAGFTGTIVSYTNSPVVGNIQRLDYTYDGLGNVLSRNDTSIEGKYVNDTFTYDALNRLYSQRTSSNVVGGYSKAKDYRYDKLGNMTYQTGIGTYKYANSRPHAVSSAGSRVYRYDEVGNMTYRNGDSIIYNPLNKPAVLKNKNGKEVRFYYGVGGSRFMKSTAEADTYYIGKAYEENVKGSEETQICYISVGDKTIGTHTEVVNTDYVESNPNYKETPFNRYFHTDALGSITAITDDAGNVVERRSYEPFGKIRVMDYGTNNNTFANRVIMTSRAFTGHEQIAELSGLIHMNARVYDSDIGRFLSADTIIQAPHDSQSYNRYSYVRNNPLVFTDPSGHSWLSKLWKKVKKYIRTIVAVVIAAVVVALTYGAMAPTVAGWLGTTYAAGTGFAASAVLGGAITGAIAGAAGGFISGFILTGSISGALTGAMWGAVGGAFSGAIGGYFGHDSSNLFNAGKNATKELYRAMSHGLSRAIISKAQGGTWKSGFWSGFLTSGFSVKDNGQTLGDFLTKTVTMAIIGGTAAELGGGKFANGAVTGAFIFMLNHGEKSLMAAIKSLWTQRSDIASDAMTGLKGGWKGYQDVRDNSPLVPRYMLKAGMTGVEMGLTWGFPTGIDQMYDFASGMFLDTQAYTGFGIAGWFARDGIDFYAESQR